MISIKEMMHAYAGTLEKTWLHDRSKTVGASEIGQCARKTWFSKNDATRDAEYLDGWGARVRGNVIEEHFWVPALRATLPEGVRLLYAGEEQATLVSDYLSATTDGLLVWPDGSSINLDCKSIDPRANLQKEKSEHTFQVQAQMGLLRQCTDHDPEISIVSYINASFFDDIKEYVVRWNPRIYAAARARAEDIMTARRALDLPPEGKLSGGRECEYCAWSSHCAEVTVAGVPERSDPLEERVITELKSLRDTERELAAAKDAVAVDHARAAEEIKQFLRSHGTRGYKGSDWSVSYSVVNGRASLDIAAIEAAGIDLSTYYKTGNQSERLIVK
jgi:hypothetical protein